MHGACIKNREACSILHECIAQMFVDSCWVFTWLHSVFHLGKAGHLPSLDPTHLGIWKIHCHTNATPLHSLTLLCPLLSECLEETLFLFSKYVQNHVQKVNWNILTNRANFSKWSSILLSFQKKIWRDFAEKWAVGSQIFTLLAVFGSKTKW